MLILRLVGSPPPILYPNFWGAPKLSSSLLDVFIKTMGTTNKLCYPHSVTEATCINLLKSSISKHTIWFLFCAYKPLWNHSILMLYVEIRWGANFCNSINLVVYCSTGMQYCTKLAKSFKFYYLTIGKNYQSLNYFLNLSYKIIFMAPSFIVRSNLLASHHKFSLD